VLGSNYTSVKGNTQDPDFLNVPKLPCVALPKSIMRVLEKNIKHDVMSTRNSNAGGYSSYQVKTEKIAVAKSRTRPLSSTNRGSERKNSMPGVISTNENHSLN
jgi:hypothetical protein